MTDLPPITTREIDALLVLLPVIIRPDFSPGEWRTPKGSMPYFNYSPDALALLVAINGLTAPFDWPAWQPEARRYVDDPAMLEHADLETLRKLLTTHVRADRFNEGHLAAMFTSGHIRAILTRLAVLRANLGEIV